MIKVLDMQLIRYINIFYRVTGIKCNHCFEYNNTILFAVPRKLVTKAIGKTNGNLEKLSNMIRKRVRIVAIPYGKDDIENFVSIIVRPIRFKAIELNDDKVIINASSQSKASLIGKGKVRLLEMENILGQYFGVRKVMVR